MALTFFIARQLAVRIDWRLAGCDNLLRICRVTPIPLEEVSKYIFVIRTILQGIQLLE